MSRVVNIDRNDLRTLVKKNNSKAIFHTVFRLLVHLSLAFLIFYCFRNGLIYTSLILCFFHFSSYSFMGLAGISHELLHNSVFKSKNLNSFFYKLFCILTFNNFGFFEVTHWKHHKSPLSNEDPKDLFIGKITFFNFLLMISFDFLSFFRRIKILVINAFGYVPGYLGKNLFSKSSNELMKVTKAARIILAFHLFLLLIFIYYSLLEFIILITLAPFIFTFVNKLFAISQHYGLNENLNDLESSRTILLNPLLSYFYANMNYHVEHHLYPGVPSYNLSKLHKIISSKYDYPNLSIGFIGLVIDLKRKGLFGNG